MREEEGERERGVGGGERRTDIVKKIETNNDTDTCNGLYRFHSIIIRMRESVYLCVYLNAGAAVIWGIIPRLIARFIVVVNAYVNVMVSPAAV